MISSHASVQERYVPLVGLVSPMGRATREYLVKQLANHFRVWVFDDKPESWVLDYAVGHSMVDPLSAGELIEAGRQIQLDAVLTWDELSTLATAEMAKELGFPGPDPEAVVCCRDKYLTRHAMADYTMRPSSTVAVGTEREALSAAASIGYPVVLKPRNLTGSVGPVLVRSAAELAESFSRVLAARIPGVESNQERPLILETYLDGPEISVDCVCFRDEVHPLFVAHKKLGFPPYFEEIGHVVDSRDLRLSDQVFLTLLRDAHRAVGFGEGWTHSEWRLTATGPELVEINPRIGGGLIPQLVEFATGLEPAVIAAEVALGKEPDLLLRRHGAAAIRFVYPRTSMQLQRVVINKAQLPAGVVRAEPLASAGQHLFLPPLAHGTGRGALLIALGEQPEACEKVLDQAESMITLIPHRVLRSDDMSAEFDFQERGTS